MRPIRSAGLFVFSCILLTAGCAGTTAEGCRTTDWYRQGYSDGWTTWYSRIDEHTASCAAHGGQPDAAAYRKGWDDGRWERSHRPFS